MKRSKPHRAAKSARSRAAGPAFAELISSGPIDDKSGPLGIRLLVQRQSQSLRARAERPTLLLPLESSIVEVASAPRQLLVDRSAWLLVPGGTRLTITAKSAVAQSVLLTMSEELIDAVVRTHPGEIDAACFRRHLESAHLLTRTNWVNELCHRYLFERAVCLKRDNDATRFLEIEMAKELYFLCQERQAEVERPSLVQKGSPIIQRALRHLEEHLFEPSALRGLAKACAVSSSTLLRIFKKELGDGPRGYLRTRRLDEALLLLKSGHYTVSDVSSAVGYESLAAFSNAFKARFGTRPLDVLAEAGSAIRAR